MVDCALSLTQHKDKNVKTDIVTKQNDVSAYWKQRESGLKQNWQVQCTEVWCLVSTQVTNLVQQKSSKAILGNAFIKAENPIGFSWSRIEHLETFQNWYFSFMLHWYFLIAALLLSSEPWLGFNPTTESISVSDTIY